MSNCSCDSSLLDVWTQFFIESISIPIVSVLGLVGNSGAILILLRPEMKSTFHQTLVTLAVIENFFLITLITDHLVDNQNQVYVILLPYFWNPFLRVQFMFIILIARYYNRTLPQGYIQRDELRLDTILKVKYFLQRLCRMFGLAYTPHYSTSLAL